MVALRKSLTIVTLLYLLYIMKWAAGINLFDNYQAPKLVKLPIEFAVQSIQLLGVEVALPGQTTPRQPHHS